MFDARTRDERGATIFPTVAKCHIASMSRTTIRHAARLGRQFRTVRELTGV